MRQTLQQYLEECVRIGALTQAMADQAWACWERIVGALQPHWARLDEPDASPGPDDEVMYTWNCNGHYLEFEIFPDGHVEVFYKHRPTGALWDAEYRVSEPPPAAVLEKLQLFTNDADPQIGSGIS